MFEIANLCLKCMKPHAYVIVANYLADSLDGHMNLIDLAMLNS